jgi:hypothetical protein
LPIKSEQFSTGTLRPHLGQELILIGFHGFKLSLGNVSKQRVEGMIFTSKHSCFAPFYYPTPAASCAENLCFLFDGLQRNRLRFVHANHGLGMSC